jgi:hypothetical protein
MPKDNDITLEEGQKVDKWLKNRIIKLLPTDSKDYKRYNL